MSGAMLLLLFLTFMAIRYAIRDQVRRAKTQKIIEEQKGTAASTPGAAPPSFPEAAPATYNLDDWRRQGFLDLEEAPTPLSTVQETPKASTTEESTGFVPYVMSSGFDAPKSPRPKAVRPVSMPKKPTVPILPAFHRESLIQAVVLKEVLDRPPSARPRLGPIASKTR